MFYICPAYQDKLFSVRVIVKHICWLWTLRWKEHLTFGLTMFFNMSPSVGSVETYSFFSKHKKIFTHPKKCNFLAVTMIEPSSIYVLYDWSKVVKTKIVSSSFCSKLVLTRHSQMHFSIGFRSYSYCLPWSLCDKNDIKILHDSSPKEPSLTVHVNSY